MTFVTAAGLFAISVRTSYRKSSAFNAYLLHEKHSFLRFKDGRICRHTFHTVVMNIVNGNIDPGVSRCIIEYANVFRPWNFQVKEERFWIMAYICHHEIRTRRVWLNETCPLWSQMHSLIIRNSPIILLLFI